MTKPIHRLRSARLGFMLAGTLLAASAGLAQAQSTFGKADATPGQISFGAADKSAPILPGSAVEISGRGFEAGQTVMVYHGMTPLRPQPLVADEKGNVSATITLPANAAVGIHPLVVVAQEPYSASIAELKVSPNVPLSGMQAYSIVQAHPARGLYQSAYSAKSGAVFVTSAKGRPPVKESELIKLDANTLGVLARTTPAVAPQRKGSDGQMQDGGVYAVYGVGVDDAHDTVWVTNTRQDTVAIYNQADLSLVKQFPPGTVTHARDVLIDQKLGKAFASATGKPEVVVFDTATNEVRGRIEIPTKQFRAEFSAASMSLDPEAHRLYVVGLSTAEVGVIDTQTEEVLNVFPVPGAVSAIGVAHDPQTGRIYVAAQGSDNLVVLDGETGKVVTDTPVGAGALNVAFDPKTGRGYVAARTNNSIVVTDKDGHILANLGPAAHVNHVALGAPGTVFAVDKSAEARGAETDTVWKITPKN